MNLYLLTQTDTTGYDTYDSCVVHCKNEDVAREMCPGTKDGVWPDMYRKKSKRSYGWVNPPNVTVTFLGVSAYQTNSNSVICSSFNAG